MREIKFRGRREFSDEYIFGYYGCHHYPTLGDFHFIVDEHGTQTSVDPETVAQLVGHDSNGREVYDGDKLTDETGNIWFAKSKGYAIYESGCEDIARDLDELTLVEAK